MARWLENDRPLLVPEDNDSTLCLDNKWERNWFASSSACVFTYDNIFSYILTCR